MVLAVLKDGPLNVTAVVQATGLSQALVSKHLKLLAIAGVVQRKPKGSLVFYQVKEQGILSFCLLLKTSFAYVGSNKLMRFRVN